MSDIDKVIEKIDKLQLSVVEMNEALTTTTTELRSFTSEIHSRGCLVGDEKRDQLYAKIKSEMKVSNATLKGVGLVSIAVGAIVAWFFKDILKIGS